MKPEEIKKVLDFDGLQEAENLTGKSYKNDKLTEEIGFMAHVVNGEMKTNMLKSLGDSTLYNAEQDYLQIVKSIGFESALVEPFFNKDGIEERLRVMWHAEYSILLVFDTFTWADDGSWEEAGKTAPPPSVNSGNFYYNWTPDIDCKNHCTSSGGYVSNGDLNKTYSLLFNPDFTPHILPDELRKIEPILDFDKYCIYKKQFEKWCDKVHDYIEKEGLIEIWSGCHDCREAIKFNISQLNENGNFVKQWIKPPFLWLLHYMDTKDEGYDHDKITNERLNKLPKHILKAIKI